MKESMMDMTIEERNARKKELRLKLEKLTEAEDAIIDAIGFIKDAVKGEAIENNAMAYIVPHLKSWLTGNNGGGVTIERIAEDFSEEYDAL